MAKNNLINVQGKQINFITMQDNDYICLTDHCQIKRW
jgi:hypothetical protein